MDGAHPTHMGGEAAAQTEGRITPFENSENSCPLGTDDTL